MMKAARGRARARHPLLRHLLRLPVGDGRVRAQRRRPRRRRLDRVQPGHAGQGDLQAARSARRRRSRRHDAARQLRLRARARLARAARSTAPSLIHERHRHRYEFNCLYERTLTEHGLRISGRSPDGKFVEIAELPGHPVVPRGAVPPGVQVEADAAASAVRGFVAASYQHKTRSTRARQRQVGRRRRAGRAGPACARYNASRDPVAARRHHDRRRQPVRADRRPVRHRKRGARASTSPGALVDDRAARSACPSSSRRRSTRRTARRAARSADPGSTKACACSRRSRRATTCRS